MRAREAEGGQPSRLGRLDADTASVTPKHSSGGTLSSLHPVRNISGCGFPCAKSRPDISASKTPRG